MNINADIRAAVPMSSKQGAAETVAESVRQEGLFRGQDVVVQDAASSLANAAEEMSFVAAEKVEKKLSERKAGSKESLKLTTTELADKYINMMSQSGSSHKLHEFLETLKKKGGKATEEDIRQMAKEQFSDVSEQYAALAFAEEALEGEVGHEELKAKIGNVKAALMKEAGPAIRAGLNIAADVMSYAKQGLEQVERLRDLYRYAVLGRETASDMYQSIMQRYGEKRFPQALDFLIRAAGSDLDSHGMGPSMERAHLETAVNNVSHVQYLGNLFRTLTDLLERVRPPTPKPMVTARTPIPEKPVVTARTPTPEKPVETVRTPTPEKRVETVRTPTPEKSVETVRTPTPEKRVETVHIPTPKYSGNAR
ncbi:MAG: type III secretion system gatekeeper subunit SctW [Verrucomicrobium sp.]|nr:type III secretion system gatekeeper subunit SctW [Verrucomicrobium sp.]